MSFTIHVNEMALVVIIYCLVLIEFAFAIGDLARFIQ